MAGRYIGTENQLMIRILDGDDAANYCKWNIEQLADLIATNAHVMLQKGSFTCAEQIHISELIINLFSLIYEDGNYGFYHCRISKWAMQIAMCYAQAGNKEETLRWAKKAMTHGAAYDALPDGQYTAPMVLHSHYHSSQGDDSQVTARREDLSDSCFDFVRDQLGF